VITVTAPLLGLLGTVIGIIIAFRDIAASDAMGKPEALATGIAQALVCTASGLAIAIPTQASYYWFRAGSTALEARRGDRRAPVPRALGPPGPARRCRRRRRPAPADRSDAGPDLPARAGRHEAERLPTRTSRRSTSRR
jgi:biopolymer transport protein ExbB